MSSRFLDTLARRVLVIDGAMGTSLHAAELPLSDYDGLENCSEVLVRPLTLLSSPPFCITMAGVLPVR